MTTFELIEIFVCIIIIAVFYKISAFEYVTLQQCCFHITTTHAVVTFHFHVTVLLVFNTVAIACRGHTSCISITLCHYSARLPCTGFLQFTYIFIK